MEELKLKVLINNEIKEKLYKEDNLTEYEKGILNLKESEKEDKD